MEAVYFMGSLSLNTFLHQQLMTPKRDTNPSENMKALKCLGAVIYDDSCGIRQNVQMDLADFYQRNLWPRQQLNEFMCQV